MSRWILILVCVLGGTELALGQTDQSTSRQSTSHEPEKPKLGQPKSMTLGIFDGKLEAKDAKNGTTGENGEPAGSVAGPNKPKMHGGNIIRSDGVQIRNDRGVRTIEMFEDKAKKQIYVEVTERYDPANHARLIRKHPQLEDYLNLFPRQIGSTQIEMVLNLKSRYQAKDREELKTNHPTAYNLFKRFYKEQKDEKKDDRMNVSR